MSTSEMYDASTPPNIAPAVPVVAFYIGGDTPHVWTDEEIAASPATFGLPIYVHDVTTGDPTVASQQIISWLNAHQWEQGTAVALDTEAVVETDWITGVNEAVTAAGWIVLDYQSKGPLPYNPPTSGGQWVADWTGQPHTYPGAAATQYASAGQLGTDYDLSLIYQNVPLHQLHRPAPPAPQPGGSIHVEVPELAEGSRGQAVTSCQLLLEHRGYSVGNAGTDGIFGQDTRAAVERFQAAEQIGTDGIVGPVTWGRLVNG